MRCARSGKKPAKIIYGAPKGGPFEDLLPLHQKLNWTRMRLNAATKKPTFRQKRTRTLIQLGGLLDKVGVLDDFNISLGDDLQDMEYIERAATLLGFLKDKIDETPLSDANKEAWRAIGESVLKEKKESS